MLDRTLGCWLSGRVYKWEDWVTGWRTRQGGLRNNDVVGQQTSRTAAAPLEVRRQIQSAVIVSLGRATRPCCGA